uniref:PUB domain-containing protein n=1 Tax=Acrobeloides nanus TaxID=290746 RepID=A0A914EFG5_9BILA
MMDTALVVSSRLGSIQTLNTIEGLEPSRYQDVPAQKSSKKIRFLPFLKLPKRGSEADENNLTSVSSAGFNDSFNISTPKPEISTPKPEIFTSAVSEAVNHRLNTYYYGIETQKFAYRKNIQELACPLRREQIAIQLKTIRQDVECLNLEENDELGYSSPYENAYKNGFQTAATMIHTLNDEVKRNNAISVIEGILKNILKNPKEKKFRRIKIAEKAFQENLKPAKGAVEFLKVVGFREEFHAGEKETFLYLQKQIPKEETLAKISYALEILRAK